MGSFWYFGGRGARREMDIRSDSPSSFLVRAGSVGFGGAAEGGERTGRSSDAAYQFFPLAFRGHRPSRYLVAHAVDEVLVIKCQSLGPRDLSHISRRLL